ncbi:hypothetical protein H821_YJM1443B00325 [Saccharomyces cerevisiae YJM1443]|nr:hypothetical protein H821_YJM1443B00325 [Saccharomyces cerevisiae YJM1443]AJP88300.1 hypothetical protein H829_YJM1479B00330 [Saccharomyces cerevisiae YJM1479]AJP91310.1 hypothetical protein H770_YJM693B00330 [Saccharomyces cerevisiae YJM693]AJQ16276.1 hypothetical protein H811_YJM1400B00329 [Saccharomyces cerevisiae YJM1400]
MFSHFEVSENRPRKQPRRKRISLSMINTVVSLDR